MILLFNKKHVFLVSILLALFILIADSFALDPNKRITQYDTRIYNTKDGLPLNSLLDVFQDSNGYIWLASQEGLIRFDGVNFELLDNQQYPGLTNNHIVDINEYENKDLWLSTEGGGLFRFNGKTFQNYNISNGLLSNSLICTATGPDKSIWALGEGGIVKLGPDSTTQFPLDIRSGAAFTNSLLVSSTGQVYLGSNDLGLFVIDSSNVDTIPLNNQQVTALYERSNGDILAGTLSGQLFIINNFSASTFKLSSLPTNNPIRDIFEDSEGNIWICQENIGIVRYYKGRFSILGPKKALNIYFLMSMIEDSEGSLWFASEAGLLQIKDNKFITFGLPEGLPIEAGTSIVEDSEGFMWLGQRNGGVSKFDRYSMEVYLTGDGLVSNYVKAVVSDKNNDIWLGTDNGLNLLQDGNIFSFPNEDMISEKNINALYVDNDGDLWIGANNGNLIQYDGNNFTQYQISDGRPGNIISIMQDTHENLWLGTFNAGLFRKSGDKLHHFTSADGFKALGVIALYEDRNGVIWIGTDQFGIYRYENNEFFNYNTTDGLSFSRIYSILEDDSGYFWCHGNSGVFRVSKIQLEDYYNQKIERITCETFDFRDGMRETECNGRRQPSAWKSSDGRLWFASLAGVTSVDPENMPVNNVLPPVYIEKVVAKDQAFNINTLASSPLEISERNIELHYTALSYLIPERVQFQYQLHGYDETWIEAGNRRSAFYTNLPSGNYSFRVKACNNDGVWNETGAALAFVIQPFWYETWWAKSVFGIFALILIVFATRLYIRKNFERQLIILKAEQATHLEQLDRMKSRFFTNISHEFRTPLTLMIGPLEDLSNGKFTGDVKAQYQMMMRNGQRLLKLINDLLDISRLEAGKLSLNTQQIELNDYLKRVIAAFESRARRGKIGLTFTPSPEKLEAYVDIDKLETILFNLLGNAFKFTPESGEIIVALGRASKNLIQTIPSAKSPVECVEISVSDSGKGIPPKELPHIFDRFHQGGSNYTKDDIVGSGIGLALAKELVALHRGEITVESEPGQGSVFKLFLPLGKAHLFPEEIAGSNISAPVAVTSQLPSLRTEKNDMSSIESSISRALSPKAPKILIVEDNADMRAYIKQQFLENYHLLEAENGEEGLAIVSNVFPDLVISDVMMPKMDGNELCRRIKEDEAVSHTPIILLTAKAGAEAQLEGLGFGADVYLEKPFNAEVLKLTVNNLLAQRRRIQQYLKDHWPILPETVDKLQIGVRDREFLDKVTAIINQFMAEESFDVSRLAKECGYSKTQLNRKLQKLTDTDSTTFLRTIRLRKAKQLLAERHGNVTEIAMMVGFNNFSYFSRKFREAFGDSPSAFLKK